MPPIERVTADLPSGAVVSFPAGERVARCQSPAFPP